MTGFNADSNTITVPENTENTGTGSQCERCNFLEPVFGVCENKGADQPVHPHSLISAFVIRFLEILIYEHASYQIQLF